MVDVKEVGQLVDVKVSSSYVEMYVCRTPVVFVVVVVLFSSSTL